MRKFYLLSLLSAVAILSACQENFKKGDKGLEYKITKSGSGPQIQKGEFMQMHICQLINDGKKDTLLNDTRTTTGPIIERYDSTSLPPEYMKILGELRKGDSLTLRVPTDTLLAQNPGMMPPFFKKGSYYVTTVKLLNIFKNQQELDSANKAEFLIKQRKDSIDDLAQMKKDEKTLSEYFTKNNIKTTRSSLGTYVELLQLGTGNLIDTSVVVKVMYRGKTMDGKVFDTNMDSTKGHTDPLSVNMTNDMSLGGGVIKGWTDGLKSLNKGAKARFYIPSPLAYGKTGAGNGAIPANAILIFEIEIADVISAADARLEMEKRNKEREARRQHYIDSLSKTKPQELKAEKDNQDTKRMP